MGCCSSDVVPDAPEVLKPDPTGNPVKVQIAAFGMFGGSRDFGIWENVRPTNGDEAKKSVWLWFNKSDLGPNTVRVDLENFQRGHLPEQPNKGKVLYYATMAERPSFQSFQRIANTGRDSFFGFFGGNTYQDNDDGFYINHNEHIPKLRKHHNAQTEGHVVTKWSMSTTVSFADGELGRGQASLQGGAVVMEVYAKGTVVTSYQHWQEQVEDRDQEGNVIGHHMVTHHGNFATELVDRVEYRLIFNGMFWCQWYCQGDSFNYNGADPSIDSPLFTTTIGGGWFSRSYFNTITKPGVDPALAMLISHVAATEYSVAQIKRDLVIRTPDRFPGMMNPFLGNGLSGVPLLFPGVPTQGNFIFKMQ